MGGQVLYLPPYSPNFNPIEQDFAKIKTLLRTAAAQTSAELTIAIEDAFAAVDQTNAKTTSPLLDTVPMNQLERGRL